ncbi:hypothetical protein KBD09_03580 [Candidatus Woesebacteria bacterium]|jgi:hypothetical protein|nr:hypothetical protein [Candidatus Woesebacteria bacterium]
MTNQNDTKPNTPVKTNPVNQVVEVMRKIDTKSPDAAKNEKSIIDKDGKRINLNDDEVRFDYFKGTFVPKNKGKNENQGKK